MAIDDKTILEGLKSFDETKRNVAIRQLCNKYQDHLYTFARKYIFDEHEALSLVHDTFMTALNKIEQFKTLTGNNSFGYWLVKILLNKIRDKIRATKREKQHVQLVPFAEFEVESDDSAPHFTNHGLTKKVSV
jgi:RNA polymerase sigma factor (sigma-70 family)